MNIVILLAIFFGSIIGTLLDSLCEEFTGKPIFYWILLPLAEIAYLIKYYIIYPIMKPKSIIWARKHHLNYFHTSKRDLYELDDDPWNEFLRLFVKPEQRSRANNDRNRYLELKKERENIENGNQD